MNNQEREERKNFIKEMRNKNFTLSKIGELLGISHQRVQQIIHPKKYKEKPITTIPQNWKPNKEIMFGGGIDSTLEGKDRIREYVRKRDDWTCQICFVMWKKGQRRLDVHHLNPEKESTYGYDKEEVNKMITLCHKCHLRLHHIREKFRNR